MKRESRSVKRVYGFGSAVIFMALLLYSLLFTEAFGTEIGQDMHSFSEGWSASNGTVWRLDDASTNRLNGAELRKRLPDDLNDGDCFCFSSRNVCVSIRIDDEVIYSFSGEDNLTGIGYGNAYHVVGLCAADAGKYIRLELTPLYENSVSGKLREAWVCPAEDYIQGKLRSGFVPAFVSVTIMLLGLFMVLVYLAIPDKENMPFNLLALGCLCIVMGTWLLADSNIPKLYTGYLYLWRYIGKTLVFLAQYSFICFLVSLTAAKRDMYKHIAFWLAFIELVVLIALRYIAGIDMTKSFPVMIYVMAALLIMLSLVIIIDNVMYCRSNGLAIYLRKFYIGFGGLAVCVISDILIFVFKHSHNDTNGDLTRCGIVFFVVYALYVFSGWWSKDRAGIERDRIVNRTLQYALAPESPDECIKSMLGYMGKELKASRVCIFEEHGSGRFRGSYEWYREDLTSDGVDILYLPYEGFVDELYRSYLNNDRKLIIRDTEEFKSVHPALYNLLKSSNINSMVGGPLENSGRLTGFLVLLDIPVADQEAAAEVISLLTYFVTQLIAQREEQKHLKYYSYNDPRCGAGNRRAYKEFLDEGLDKSSAFGYVSCRIKDFAEISSNRGYEAGDNVLADTAKCLSEVFGNENVYRLGGGEFAVFGFETDESFFDSDVARAGKLISDRKINVAIGGVYCTYGTMNMNGVVKRAREHTTVN
ncbi:MAG: GGDEF domain-containing protein [Lachnospiraceae bacterium]|nr:GGDEF domain-containing protein [Lachnospiraceae bacterium]